MSHDILSLSQAPPLMGPLGDEHLITVITEDGLRNVEAATLKDHFNTELESRITGIENRLTDLGTGGGGGGRPLGKVKHVVTFNQMPSGILTLENDEVVPPGTFVLLAEQEQTTNNGIWIVAADAWRAAFASYQPYDWVIVDSFTDIDATQSGEVVGQKWVNLAEEAAEHGSGGDNWTLLDVGFRTEPYASRVEDNTFEGEADFCDRVQLTRTLADRATRRHSLVFFNDHADGPGVNNVIGGFEATFDTEYVYNTAGSVHIRTIPLDDNRPHTEIAFSTAYGGYGEGVRWTISPAGELLPQIHPEYGVGTIGNDQTYVQSVYTERLFLQDSIISESRVDFLQEAGGFQNIAVGGVRTEGNVRFTLPDVGVKFLDSEQARIYGGYATSQITFEGDNGSITNVYYQSSENETDGHVFEAGGDQVFGIYKDRLYSTVEIVAPSFNGVATSAERLATPVRINGQEFDGTQDIEIDVGNAGTFEFTQEEPSSTWIIEHNLGFRPNVITMDSDYVRIEGYVRNPTVNRTEIIYSEPVSGYATLS